MQLKVFSDERDPKNQREFVFHPFIQDTKINDSPFDFMYIIDSNPDVYIDKWESAAADAIYLQYFSPLYAKRNSDYDNYEKNQKRLSRDLYSTFYGSYGCSVLLLPDQDLLEYCTRCKTGDALREYLFAELKIEKPGGNVHSYTLSPREAEQFPTQEEKNRERDIKFTLYICDFIKDVEIVKEREIEERKMGPMSKSLFRNGFTLNPNLSAFHEQKITTIDNIISNITVDKVAEIIKTDNFDQAEPDMVQQSLDSFELFYRGGADIYDIYSFARIVDNDGKREFHSEGLFGKFFSHINDQVLTGAKLDYNTLLPQEVTKNQRREDNGLNIVMNNFADRVKNDQEHLSSFASRLRASSSAFKNSFDQSSVTKLLAEQKAKFEVQRLFVIYLTYILDIRCKLINELLLKCGKEPGLVIGEYVSKKDEIISREKLEKTSLYSMQDRGKQLINQAGDADFAQQVKVSNDALNGHFNMVRLVLLVGFYREIYEHMRTVVIQLAGVYRDFGEQAAQEIEKLKKSARDLMDNPGAKSQANTYDNDIEALQDFNGKRLWDHYYAHFVQGQVHPSEESVYKAIAEALQSSDLRSTADKIAAIAASLRVEVEKVLSHAIVGKATEGPREHRGLTLNDALRREAQLKYRQHLDAVGRLDVKTMDAWTHVVNAPEKDIKAKSEQDLLKEMNEFCHNYLGSKLMICVRRSSIMANINNEDPDVVEFSCRQAHVCYDTQLYGTPKNDVRSLDFPDIIRKVAPEFRDENYNEQGKMVIFYQAILGIPLFAFRNVTGALKEAYNRRVPERNFAEPRKGRQYPLHVDRNWEPGDPGTDELRLPISLDPEEATGRTRSGNATRSQFFGYWYALYRADILKRDDEGFFVPQGVLRNHSGREIRLGATVRQAIHQLLRFPNAQATLQEEFLARQQDTPLREQLVASLQYCKDKLGGDVWDQGDQEPELEELRLLLQENLDYISAEDKRQAVKQSSRQVTRDTVLAGS